jgi:DNA-directed RNA polymerase subunit M/transcription elongation factor TFIIS
MLYISISRDDANQLMYYCRNCGANDDQLVSESLCVLETNFKRGEQKFNHIINEYTKKDPTLPRIYNVKCPNGGCKTNEETHKLAAEVIYMRYDDENMKYLYICVECDTVWKTDDNK